MHIYSFWLKPNNDYDRQRREHTKKGTSSTQNITMKRDSRQPNRTPMTVFDYYKQKMALFSAAILTITTILLGSTSIAYGAASATMNISPASGTVTQGSDIQLSITIVAGSNQIIAAQACVKYDNTKLKLILTDTSRAALQSKLPADPPADCPAGEIQISRYDTSTATGTFNHGFITFRALQANTTDAVSIDMAKSYVMDNATTNASGYVSILSGTTGSTVTLNPVPVPPSSAPPASPAPTVTRTTQPASKTSPTTNPAPAQTIITPRLTATTPAEVNAPQQTSTPTKITKKTTDKKSSSGTILYIVGGIIVLAIAAAIAAQLLKIMKTAKVKSSSIIAPTAVVTSNNDAAKIDLSELSDPTIPAPSSVIQPNTEPTPSPDNDDAMYTKYR